MNTTQIIVIVCVLAAIALASMFYAAATAQEIEEKPAPKMEVGKVSHSHCTESTDTQKPKRKKKRYYNKKKKPTNANNAQVEKRPVGRPRKVQ
jgi:flagellar basal body-associated protein FliL